MSKVAEEAPDNPDNKPLSISRLADTQKSDAHVSQLLHIAEHCAKYLYVRTEVGETLEVQPVIYKEAGKTYEMVHVRLRDLIDETPRWSLNPTLHEREATKLIDSAMELYNQKTINAKIYNRPSIFLRPKIGKFDPGWIVWIGGDVPTKRDLHAIGISPAVAMQNFDEAYYALEKVADAQPAVVVTPAPKRALRKPKKT